YMAHDPLNQCKVGDKVQIVESRPLSKRKRWQVIGIIEKGNMET
ncbi:MAG TPA: 30S ribosomal protein S17, partial [Desulfobacteraceae bacterium]|nr:30S ribosomal protein S17 [Desulfobacteraceae bacterium]